ncbi:hypothetical protein [Paraburkholderia diazotrophica]|nr:hypothetical protein [Paraburkholderia diazotrophica]
MHYIDEGTDTGTSPIVMMHGFPSLLEWDAVADEVARDLDSASA